MKLPKYLSGKKCKCQATIGFDDIREIGVHLEQKEVFIRFKCGYCGFKGCISIKEKFNEFLDSLNNEQKDLAEKSIVSPKKPKSFTLAQVRKAKKAIRDSEDVLSLFPKSPIEGKKRKNQNKKK